MTDDELRLSPVTAEADLAIIEDLVDTPGGGEFAWFGFPRPGDHRRRWTENGLLDPARSVLMVLRGDERLGFVSFRRKDGFHGAWYWEMGIGLVSSARGKGYGTIAQRMLVGYLFTHSPAHRIEADTELENVAEQRALEKAGFTREGVIRQVVWRNGAWRDGVIYSILRAEYHGAASRHSATP
ncbi:MAG TPA: GNAT family protein [Pseudonocardiaceae bacterium]